MTPRPATPEWVVCPECGMPEKCKRMEVCQLTPGSDTPETDALGAKWVTRERGAGFTISPEASELYEHARSLERRLALAQTEIKGHMRVEDELKAAFDGLLEAAKVRTAII